MNPEQTRLQYLFEKYFEKTASADERTELANLISVESNHDEVMQLFTAAWEKYRGDGMIIAGEKSDEILEHILGKNDLADNVVPLHPLKRWAVAASIILAIGVGGYFLFFNKNKQNEIAKINNSLPHDVAAPNVARATLKTDDGRIIYLDSVANGSIATQGNVNVEKLANGQIKYSQVSGVVSQEVHYHTISNPRGSKVEPLTLIDGTQVWLNAESSITYPTAFVGNERKVTITGEADFVVTHNENMPFKVIANGIEIRDVGTEFNVNAYSDEPDIKVTLLEGSVKVSIVNGESSMIKPGEQAQVSSAIKVVKGVDLEEVMAWKNGLFKMDKADIGTIMRQLARWYDVNVEYQNGVPKGTISGEVPRTLNLSEVLKVYEYSGMHFSIEGKTIVVKP